MLCTGSRKATRVAYAASLPDFLLPAFSQHVSTRPFTHSTKRPSRIGSAPVTLPPEVLFRVVEPPISKKKITSRIVAPRIVELEGPLGEH